MPKIDAAPSLPGPPANRKEARSDLAQVDRAKPPSTMTYWPHLKTVQFAAAQRRHTGARISRHDHARFADRVGRSISGRGVLKSCLRKSILPFSPSLGLR